MPPITSKDAAWPRTRADLLTPVAGAASTSLERAGSEVEAAPSGRRRGLVLLSQLGSLVLSGAVVVWLFHRIDAGAVSRAAGRISWIALAVGVALNIPCTVLRARRSQLVLNRLGHRVPRLRMVGVQLAGQILSWLTPAATGDLVRPYMWRTHDGVPAGAGVVTVLYERLSTFLQLVVIGGVLCSPLVVPAGGVAALVAVSCALLAAPWWLSLVSRRFGANGSGTAGRAGPGLAASLWRAVGRIQALAGSGRLGLTFTAYTLTVFLLSGAQIALLAAAIGATLPLWIAAGAYCLSQAAGSLSSLPFGIGASDAVLVALLVASGLTAIDAAAVTVLVRLVMTVPLGIAGALAIVALGRPRWSEVTAR